MADHPAFSSRSDCPIPYIPEIVLDLIKDCVIPPAPPPFFEADIFPPILPPITIGCPKIEVKTNLLTGRPAKQVKTRDFKSLVTKQDGEDDCFPKINIDLTLPCVLAKNMYVDVADPSYPMEVIGCETYEDGTRYLLINRPTKDSVSAADIVFPIDPILAFPDYQFGCVHEGFDLIYVDYDGADPAQDDDIGTQVGSFKFKKDNTGFKVVSANVVEKKAWIRPNTGGGGGGTPAQVVQAVANGANGVVSTKVMTLKADVAASPNFTLSDTATNINYFKL